MIQNKIIYEITIFIKFSIFLYLLIHKNFEHFNDENTFNPDYKMKYYFPKLWKIKKYLKIYHFEKYIKNCKNKKKFNRIKINNKFPFLSVCICSYNSEKYIENVISSILNQSFQDFEIIIIDDFSNDNSPKIIKSFEKQDNRLKLNNHMRNYGIYRSRVDAINNSKGKYILFIDADDMILNKHLFQILFFYSSFYNLDIIEFLVLYQVDGENNLVRPLTQILTHLHNYSKSIIEQPELSTIIFYIPQTHNYSSVICRTLWNKIYKKDIMLNSINYIGKKIYSKSYINYGEDTIMNILNFHFAKNYTNINIYGYMYNVRNDSISHFTDDIKKSHSLNLGIYHYLNFFYKYILELNLDRELLYLELVSFNKQISLFKMNESVFFRKKMKSLFDRIIHDDKASSGFKKYIIKLIKN